MPAKPNPALGLVLGIIVGYAGVVGGSYAAARLSLSRNVTFKNVGVDQVQWLAMLVVVAAILGLLMAPRVIGAGVMVGAGGLMTVVGLAITLVPIKNAYDVIKLFQVPSSRIVPYILADGSITFIGIVLLLAGIGRWAGDARTTAALGGQDPAVPAQQQWGGYPGQQQQPPYPGQRQPHPYHPGQQQPGNTFPDQQPPR